MKNGKVDNFTFLTTGPVSKVILTMAVPTIISMLVTSIYNIVDTWYVGQLNTQATAAVGIVFPIMSLFQATGFFFGQGSGTFISRKLGAKENDKAIHMATTAFAGTLATGLLIMLAGLIFLKPLSEALGSTPTILPYTKEYLGIILLGAPAMTCSTTLNNQMRFQGNAKNAMYGLLTGAVTNIILVPIFTFALGMGIRGTAIGTVMSQYISLIVLIAMSEHGENISIRPRNFSTDPLYLKEIFRGGTPSLTRQGLAAISTLMLNIAAARYGDAAVAGMSIVNRITFVIFATIIGIGQGFQPFCGFNYGAKNFDRVRKGFFFALKISLAFLLPCCIIGFIFAGPIIDILRHDPEVVKVGATAFRWQIITYPLVAMITVSNMCLQTSGRSIPANILAAARNGLFFIPLILLLPQLLGLLGVEACQSIADIFSFALAVPLMTRYFNSIKNKAQ